MSHTFYHNVSDTTDTIVSCHPPLSFATAILSPEATALNKEHIFKLFSIATWHCAVFGHVPYLLLQSCGHNGHDYLVPTSTVFCNNHIFPSHHSDEEERDELNFILFSITGWQCVTCRHVPYLLLKRCGHNEHGRLGWLCSVFCNSHTLPSHHKVEEEGRVFISSSIAAWHCVACGHVPYLGYNVSYTTDTLEYHSPSSYVTTIFCSVTAALKKNEASYILYCSVLQRGTL